MYQNLSQLVRFCRLYIKNILVLFSVHCNYFEFALHYDGNFEKQVLLKLKKMLLGRFQLAT